MSFSIYEAVMQWTNRLRSQESIKDGVVSLWWNLYIIEKSISTSSSRTVLPCEWWIGYIRNGRSVYTWSTLFAVECIRIQVKSPRPFRRSKRKTKDTCASKLGKPFWAVETPEKVAFRPQLLSLRSKIMQQLRSSSMWLYWNEDQGYSCLQTPKPHRNSQAANAPANYSSTTQLPYWKSWTEIPARAAQTKAWREKAQPQSSSLLRRRSSWLDTSHHRYQGISVAMHAQWKEHPKATESFRTRIQICRAWGQQGVNSCRGLVVCKHPWQTRYIQGWDTDILHRVCFCRPIWGGIPLGRGFRISHMWPVRFPGGNSLAVWRVRGCGHHKHRCHLRRWCCDMGLGSSGQEKRTIERFNVSIFIMYMHLWMG